MERVFPKDPNPLKLKAFEGKDLIVVIK